MFRKFMKRLAERKRERLREEMRESIRRKMSGLSFGEKVEINLSEIIRKKQKEEGRVK